MTHRLILSFPHSVITLESDNIDSLSKLSDFCRNELGAYHSSTNVEEYTINNELSEKQSEKFHSLLYNLDLF